MNRDDYIRELETLEYSIRREEAKRKLTDIENEYLKQRIAELECDYSSAQQALKAAVEQNEQVHQAYDMVIRGRIQKASEQIERRFPGLWENELKSEIVKP